MQSHPIEGVEFSRDYISEETVALLFREEAPEAEPEGRVVTSLPPPPGLDEEGAFSLAWAELMADPEFAEAVAEHAYSQSQGLRDLRASLATGVTELTDARTAAMLDVEYTRGIEEDRFVHRIDGEPILAIGIDVVGAEDASNNLELWLQVAFVVIDVLALIAAAAGVVVHVMKKQVAKQLKGVLGVVKKLFKTAQAKQLQRLKEANNVIGTISTVLQAIRTAGAGFKTILSIFLGSLSIWWIALAILQLTAAILLFLATAGADLARHALLLVNSAIELWQDVADLIAAIARQEAV